jgi:hypothetical protein
VKRAGGLFEAITDYSNIRLAFLKTLRGSRHSPEVIRFCRNTDANLAALRGKLLSPDCGWGGYRSFLITDPKLRVISTAPLEQRIMHHAIMNVLEEILTRPLICNSFACRKNKGTHAAVRFAFKQCKCHPFFLKLDIRKYFDSIHHDSLKNILRRLIKDSRVIKLLDNIIDSYQIADGRGIPIGNLTSQFFANLYLSPLDHYILEELRPSAYCRYMDDFVLWSDSNRQLQSSLLHIGQFAAEKLRLQLKPAVHGTVKTGLPFLGFLIKDSGIYLLQKSKRRVIARIKEINAQLDSGIIGEAKAAERARSVLSAINLARTNRLRRRLCA